MNLEDKKTAGPSVTRRQVLGSAGAAAGAAAVMTAAPWADLHAEVEQLKSEGWEAHPVACNICGGYCGLLAMHKKGEPVSRATVRIMPNPSHPQRGYCARGAGAMWTWDHPLRLKKPLMRVGEKGEGKFKEVTWDEALTEIANRLKAIVAESGERSVVLTSHNFSGFQKWFAAGLGTPNVIGHSSTCNTASVVGRRLVFGKGFDGAGKVEPDYESCRYLLMVGRTLNCAVGVQNTLTRARENGCEVVFVDPRMPETVFSGAKWVPIRPGTDSAFLLAMMNVALREDLADKDFLARHTNSGYLVTDDQKPVTQAMLVEGGSADLYAVIDAASGAVSYRGVKKNEAGAAVAFEEDAAVVPALDYEGNITFADGSEKHVQACFKFFAATAAKYDPKTASDITGIPADQIVQIARDFFKKGGVCDDGWYSARNGNDTPAYALMCRLNLMTGMLDQKGGFVVTAGGGFSSPGASLSGEKGKGPHGEAFKVPGAEAKPMDKLFYAEGSGTFSAIFDAIHTGKPYPIRAVFATGTTLFHREANSARLARALTALDLFVVQDILPHEVTDYADFVLPSTFFLEWHDYAGVKWALNGNVQKIDAGINPPEGCEARHEIWQFCEILRRGWPERAAERLGYTKECTTAEEFNKWYRSNIDKAWTKFIAKKNAEKPGDGDRIAREVEEQGWSQTNVKKYGVYPYKKPFGTLTGKPEMFSFLVATKYQGKGLTPAADWEQVKAYTLPKPRSDEFVLVTGKDSSSCSGVAIFAKPSQFLGDRTVWMNPADADRLGIKNGDKVELTGLDNRVTGVTKVKVTNRVNTGCLFAHGFSGGVRTKKFAAPGYEWTREGVNSHWFCMGYREAVTGSLANNSSVRVKRI